MALKVYSASSDRGTLVWIKLNMVSLFTSKEYGDNIKIGMFNRGTVGYAGKDLCITANDYDLFTNFVNAVRSADSKDTIKVSVQDNDEDDMCGYKVIVEKISTSIIVQEREEQKFTLKEEVKKIITCKDVFKFNDLGAEYNVPRAYHHSDIAFDANKFNEILKVFNEKCYDQILIARDADNITFRGKKQSANDWDAPFNIKGLIKNKYCCDSISHVLRLADLKPLWQQRDGEFNELEVCMRENLPVRFSFSSDRFQKVEVFINPIVLDKQPGISKKKRKAPNGEQGTGAKVPKNKISEQA
jgi:hypothetical protein